MIEPVVSPYVLHCYSARCITIRCSKRVLLLDGRARARAEVLVLMDRGSASPETAFRERRASLKRRRHIAANVVVRWEFRIRKPELVALVRNAPRRSCDAAAAAAPLLLPSAASYACRSCWRAHAAGAPASMNPPRARAPSATPNCPLSRCCCCRPPTPLLGWAHLGSLAVAGCVCRAPRAQTEGHGRRARACGRGASASVVGSPVRERRGGPGRGCVMLSCVAVLRFLHSPSVQRSLPTTSAHPHPFAHLVSVHPAALTIFSKRRRTTTTTTPDDVVEFTGTQRNEVTIFTDDEA